MNSTFKLLLTILFSILLCIACKKEKGQGQKYANFLFVFADNHSPFNLKVYNAKSILEASSIYKQSKGSITFNGIRHMESWSGVLYTPSLHMFMSRHALWHLPAYGKNMQNPIDLDSLEIQTIEVVFNRAGYKTMRSCKEENLYAATNKQFSLMHNATKQGGAEESGNTWHENKVLSYLNNREKNQERRLEIFTKYGVVNYSNENSIPPANTKQPQLQKNYLLEHPFFHGYPKLESPLRKIQLFNFAANLNGYLPEHNKSGELETNVIDNPKYAKKLEVEQIETDNDPYSL